MRERCYIRVGDAVQRRGHRRIAAFALVVAVSAHFGSQIRLSLSRQAWDLMLSPEVREVAYAAA